MLCKNFIFIFVNACFNEISPPPAEYFPYCFGGGAVEYIDYLVTLHFVDTHVWHKEWTIPIQSKPLNAI